MWIFDWWRFGYKPSGIEQAKFEHSPLGNFLNKWLDKDEDKKGGLLKRLKNIEGKNEELLDAFNAANKVSKAAKNESDYNHDFKYVFYKFYRYFTERKLNRISLNSKFNEMNNFYELLNSFINAHVAITVETKDRKDGILNNVKLLYDIYFDTYKNNYESENLNDEEKRKHGYK